MPDILTAVGSIPSSTSLLTVRKYTLALAVREQSQCCDPRGQVTGPWSQGPILEHGPHESCNCGFCRKTCSQVSERLFLSRLLWLASLGRLLRWNARLIENLSSEETRLHGLINSAGIMAVPYEKSKDSYESQFQVCTSLVHPIRMHLHVKKF